MQKLGVPQSSSNEFYRIFVGGLSFEVDNNRLREAFAPFNNLKKALVIRDQRSGQSRGYGFVTFSCKKSFNTALATPVVILGRKADCHPVLTKGALKEQEQRDMANKVFVGGISQNTLAEDLKRYFARYGPIIETRILYDGKTGKSRGFGFVLYKSAASVDALFAIPEHKIKGKIVEIKKFSKDKDGNEDSKADITQDFPTDSPATDFSPQPNDVLNEKPKSTEGLGLSLCTTASNGASRELQDLIQSKQDCGGLATRSADANQDKPAGKKLRFDSISTLSDRELGLSKVEPNSGTTKLESSSTQVKSKPAKKKSKQVPSQFRCNPGTQVYEQPEQQADYYGQMPGYSPYPEYLQPEYQGYHASNYYGYDNYPYQDAYHEPVSHQTYGSFDYQPSQTQFHHYPSTMQSGYLASESDPWCHQQAQWYPESQPNVRSSAPTQEKHFSIGGFYSKLQQEEQHMRGGSIISPYHVASISQSPFRR